jgi:Rps23 Pro-64 3,4-dihydroxylase Tpa1-like proline 4-hydroxylase
MNKDLCNQILAHAADCEWKRFDKITPSGIYFRYLYHWLLQDDIQGEFDAELKAYAESVIPQVENREIDYRLSKYEPGDIMERHKDMSAYRTHTALIQLSDPSTYEGGDLFVNDELVSREQGSCYLFDSQTTWHHVTPVTKGIRYSLVLWSYSFPTQEIKHD